MTTVSVSSAAGAESPTTWGENQVTNGSFESGPEGWRTNETLTVGNGGTDGDRRAALTTSKRRVSLHDAGTSATGADALSTWRATTWLRSTDPSVSGRITVVQRSGDTTVLHAQEFRLPDRKWQQVQLDLVVTEGDSSLDFRLNAGPIRGNDAMLLVDDVRLQQEVVVEPTPTPALTPEPSALDLVGSNGSNANRLDHSVKVPGSVQPGDALLLHWAANNNNGTVTPPSGWTKVTGTDRDGVRGGLWLRTAKAGDAGSAVTIETSARAKSDVGVTAYRNAHEAPIDAWKAAVQTTPGSSHQAPAVTPSHAGSWVVTYAAAKSSVDNSLKVPAGLTGRRASTGTGGGRITAVLADSAAPVEAGVAQGPFTFEGTAQAGRAVMYSLVLRTGAPEPQPAPKMLVGANYSTQSKVDESTYINPEVARIYYQGSDRIDQHPFFGRNTVEEAWAAGNRTFLVSHKDSNITHVRAWLDAILADPRAAEIDKIILTFYHEPGDNAEDAAKAYNGNAYQANDGFLQWVDWYHGKQQMQTDIVHEREAAGLPFELRTAQILMAYTMYSPRESRENQYWLPAAGEVDLMGWDAYMHDRTAASMAAKFSAALAEGGYSEFIIGETGLDRSRQVTPQGQQEMRDFRNLMRDEGCVAMSWWNSNLAPDNGKDNTFTPEGAAAWFEENV